MDEDFSSSAAAVNVTNPVATAPIKHSSRVFHRRLSGTPILFAEKAAEFPIKSAEDLQKFQDLLAQFPQPPLHEKTATTAAASSAGNPPSSVGSWTSGLKGFASNLFSNKHT